MEVTEVSKILSDAWKAVEASKVPVSVQGVAFAHAAQLLSGPSPARQGGKDEQAFSRSTKVAPATSNGSKSNPTTTEHSDNVTDAPNSDEFYENLVNHTEVERGVLEDLFHYANDKISLNVTGRQLGTSLRQKQQAVGVLLSVAYQYGLGHSTTSINVIRDECTRLRSVDHNLPTYLRGTNGVRLVGDGRIKEIQLRDAALDVFKVEAERIAGKSGASE